MTSLFKLESKMAFALLVAALIVSPLFGLTLADEAAAGRQWS